MLISSQPPTKRQILLAGSFLAALVALYLATLPFSHVQLPRLDIFVPILDVVLFVIDIITAVLLYSHASVLRSHSLRILANGYLFTALIIIAHGLTFPGAFSETGLFGASIQTSAYLQTIWRASLPCTAIVYALLKGKDQDIGTVEAGGRHTLVNVAAVLAVATVVVWLTTLEAGRLPATMVSVQQKAWSFDLPFMIPLELTAIALLWWRRSSVLDLWLLLVLCVWLIATLLVGATAYRYSLVWYQSRIYGLLACSLVLLALLGQMGTLYARLAVSILKQRRERDIRLMQVDATLAVVSHEINQPLAAIALNGGAGLKVLQRSGQEDAALAEILDDIVRDSNRVSAIVSGIRALFRQEEQAKEAVNIEDLIVGTLAMMELDFQAPGVVLETKLTGKTICVRANRIQLQQVLLNLLTNAVEAVTEGATRDRRISLATELKNAQFVLTVEDTGPGLVMGAEETIFEPFMTTKARGAGLGLPICRTIIEAHGGRIWAARAAHGGARLGFSVPVDLAVA